MSASQTSSSQSNSEVFDLELSPCDAFVADRVHDLIDKLQSAYVEESRECSLTRAELARRMGTDRAEVTRILQGKQNVTLKKLFAFVFAMGRDLSMNVPKLSERCDVAGQNNFATTEVIPLRFSAGEGSLGPVGSEYPCLTTTLNLKTTSDSPRVTFVTLSQRRRTGNGCLVER